MRQRNMSRNKEYEFKYRRNRIWRCIARMNHIKDLKYLKHAAMLTCVAAVLTGLSGICAFAEITSATVEGTHAMEEPQPSEIPTPSEFAHITECYLNTDGQIVIDGRMEGSWSDLAYYDNYLYLFELKPYQTDLKDRTDYCAWITKGDSLHFQLSLNKGTKEDRLYSHFMIAVFNGTEYIPVSNDVYITNPEILAKNKEPYRSAQNKKGLLIQTTDSMLADAFELGVNHVNVNIAFQQLLGSGIDYEYDGKKYHFNKALLDNYDHVIRRLSEKNMTVNAIILNGWNDAAPQLFRPETKKQPESTAMYYGFNTSTEEGVETLKAIASFLAERYSSLKSPYGKVSNWIIGNEINNQYWNYTGPMDLTSYVQEYERAFRIFYTAVKSMNQNDRLFVSTDYCWYSEADGALKYHAKDIVDQFAEITNAHGPMNWGLAYHPYPIPLVEPEFWDDANTGKIKQSEYSPVVNLANLNVLTDYMQKPSMRNPDGTVRHIILSEQGFTSVSNTRGDVSELQAAAIAYAYYIIDSNPYIDAFIMSRQVDAPEEVKAGESFGLWKCDMSKENDIVPTMRKKSWQVYKNVDIRSRTLETTDFAKKLIGIQKWSDVIPNFKWKSLE